MNDSGLTSGKPTPEIATLTPRDQPQATRMAGLFSLGVTLIVLLVLALMASPPSALKTALNLPNVEFARIMAMIPHSIGFWAIFAAYYLAAPFTEWLIYYRLWHLPFSGMGALLRKMVSNELLLGYLGEVQFYAWARARLNMVAAPFGAIKDVTILSALTGNMATLAMLGFAWPLVSSGKLGMETELIFKSLGVVLVTSFVILLFRQRLFSLPRRQLVLVTLVHFARIFGIVGLAALMWHHILPDVPYALWLVLATLRMLVSRLPLIPNKDVVFAGLAVFLMGHDAEIADLMTMMAGLLLIAHVVVGMVFGAAELINSRKDGG